MPETPSFQHYLLRIALIGVSPRVARLLSVPDDLTLDELHEVLQLVFGWSRESYYRFRIHGQEIGTPRQGRSRLLREFRLRQREKFFYTYDLLDLWEWELRVLDIQPQATAEADPRCLGGRNAVPPEGCGGPRSYMRILDRHKYCPPVVEQALVEQALERMAKALPDQNSRELLRDLVSQGLERAVRRLEDYARFEPEHFSLKEAKERLSRFCPYGRTRP